MVIGPAKILAVETKYRAKRPGKAGGRDHETILDGKKIQFPSDYPPDKQNKAVQTVLEQAKLLCVDMSLSTRQ